MYIYIYIKMPENYKDNIISHYEKDRLNLVLDMTDFCDIFLGCIAHYRLHRPIFVAAD